MFTRELDSEKRLQCPLKRKPFCSVFNNRLVQCSQFSFIYGQGRIEFVDARENVEENSLGFCIMNYFRKLGEVAFQTATVILHAPNSITEHSEANSGSNLVERVDRV